MSQTMTLQQLNTRLGRLESEITAIRRTLDRLQQNTDLAVSSPNPMLSHKIDLSQYMHQLLQRFSIRGQAAGPEMLQKQMAQANLSPNELSHSLIEARGE